MSVAVTESLRSASRFMRVVASFVLAAFLSLTLQPLALAAQLPSAAPAARTAPVSNEANLAKTLEDIEDRLEKLENKLSKKASARQEQDDIKRLRQSLDALDQQALADFEKIGKHLKDKNLPTVILDRHTQTVNTYKTEMAALKANVDDVEKAPSDEDQKLKARKAKKHLKDKNKKRARPKFDPNDLPNKSLQPNPKNKPKLKKQDFERAALFDNPNVWLAALGDFTYDKLPGATDPAYLAASTEITLTDAVKAKALELGHDPVKIHNWVRNNVEWLPTWGATQDADVTLGSKRGNALDIASLTLALFRASGIPARYVHGTIEVPEDKFRNWVGGFTNVTAAGNFASSGGIPVTTIVSGGRITKVQLEHVWVEAAIDFQPSRGAINRSADSWVQLDPSYKQYQDLPGLDVVQIAGIDPAALAQSFSSSGTINTTEGWVQNLNPTGLQNAQTQAQTAVQTYIQNNLTNPTVGDVIGGRKIIMQTTSVLPAALPYRSLLIGARYGNLPAALQHTMTFAFGLDPIGEPINPVTFPWSRLNNHKVTLSFKPATVADEQTLASLLPPGPITDPSQLPSSIPSYLISVIPELAVDGQVVSQGGPMRLGQDLIFYYGVERVNGLGSHSYTYPVVAGSYLGVAVAGGSVSPITLNNIKDKLTQTQTKLQSGDTSLIGTLNREDILGDMFHAGTLGYFGEYLALAHVASQPQQARHTLPYGYGTFGYEPNVDTIFGLPRAITPGGIGVNVRLGWVIHALDGDATKRPSLSLQTGMLSSALEHAVPEQMFSTQSQPAQGVSAAKALQIASSQGQRIYHVTPQNQAQALPNLHLDGLAMSEITQALATGKEVVAHTDRISVPGWTGEGYILFDPATGSGAYKITGGSNGGYLALALSILLAWIALFPAGAVAVHFFPLSIFIFTLVVTVLTFANVLNSLQGCGGSIGVGMALIASLLAALPGEGATVIRALLEGFILEEGFTSAENAVCGLT